MRVLLTSGPTREPLDPVRFLSNGSSGRMGAALATALVAAGHEVVVVSGPVAIDYPPEATVRHVITTAEMLAAALETFPSCDGLIAAAAPCDFRPRAPAATKLPKPSGPTTLELEPTPDVLATLAESKGPRFAVGFALESDAGSDSGRAKALAKLRRKQCDLIVLNGPEAMHGATTATEVLDPFGQVVARCNGEKSLVAAELVALVVARFGPRR
jgi:phosphopantothenoylcysteine decarboxylase/phosphopantothenate--cysteine ligase